jgi:hypothetical protein
MDQPVSQFAADLASRYGGAAPEVTPPVNAVLEAMLGHRSVRAYLPDALPAGTLETLVAAAQSAPTSSNLQAWSVVAVQDPDRKGRLADLANSQRFIRQAPLFFTQPLIQVENLVLEGKLHFDGNPVFTWMVSNVEVSTSKFSGLKHPTKSREENKIDGPVALFMGLGRAMVGAVQECSIDDFINSPVIG